MVRLPPYARTTLTIYEYAIRFLDKNMETPFLVKAIPTSQDDLESDVLRTLQSYVSEPNEDDGTIPAAERCFFKRISESHATETWHAYCNGVFILPQLFDKMRELASLSFEGLIAIAENDPGKRICWTLCYLAISCPI